MKLSAVLLIFVVSVALAAGGLVQSLVFPTPTDSSYILVTPQKSLDLRAFTLCLRVATELKGRREIILFAYRTYSYFSDALNLWRERDGRISLYMASEGVIFEMPSLGPLQTHLCVTWDSSTGATSIFMDGKKSQAKIYKKNHRVSPEGQVIIGQDPDDYLGGFDSDQSFVGEISDINLWSTVLPDHQIRDMVTGRPTQTPDVINWDEASLNVTGNVEVIPREV